MLSRREFSAIVIIGFVFVALRLLFLFLTPYSLHAEELKIGSLGHDLLFEHGLRLPFWGYLDSPHAGGSLLAGISAIPFYVIFGDRYLALKITALFYSLSTVLLWYRLLALEITERKQALFLSFLVFFSFTTPSYLQRSLLLLGNNVELMFFNVLIISYFWAFRDGMLLDRKKCFVLGAMCGFSVWVQFMSLYLFISIIVFLLLDGQHKALIGQLPYLLGGFLCGTSPLWLYNINYEWATFTADARRAFLVTSLSKFSSLMLVLLPASFHFLDIGSIKAQLFGYSLYVSFLLAVVIHVFQGWKNSNKNRKRSFRLESFLILYLGVFIFFTAFTSAPATSSEIPGWNSMNVHAEYYLVSLQPILFALLILLLKHRSTIRDVIIPLVGIQLIVGYCTLFQSPRFNSRIFRPSHSTGANTEECGFNFVHNPALFLSFEKKIPSELKAHYFNGAGFAVHSLLPNRADDVAKMFDRLFVADTDISEELFGKLLRGAILGEGPRTESSITTSYKRLLSIVPSDYHDTLMRIYHQEIDITRRKQPKADTAKANSRGGLAYA